MRVGADGPKGDGPDGAWSVGKPVPTAAASLLTGSAASTSGIVIPVLGGTPAIARIAVSMTGFDHLSGAVAQDAAGIQPEAGAWFDGLSVSIRATPGEGGGVRLAVLGSLSWVRPAASSAELAYRIPIGLDGRTGPGGLDNAEARRVSIPLVATGEARLDGEVRLSEADVKDGVAYVLAAVAMRDEKGAPMTLLLVGTVRR